MATILNEEFAHKKLHLVEDYSNISKKLCQNICNETAIKANFYFSNYK